MKEKEEAVMKVTDIFEEKRKMGKPVLSFEIFPPKKAEALKNVRAFVRSPPGFYQRDIWGRGKRGG